MTKRPETMEQTERTKRTGGEDMISIQEHYDNLWGPVNEMRQGCGLDCESCSFFKHDLLAALLDGMDEHPEVVALFNSYSREEDGAGSCKHWETCWLLERLMLLLAREGSKLEQVDRNLSFVHMMGVVQYS